MNKSETVVVKDLVLVGGGHSHVAVLKRFGMRPLPGLRVTLITRDLHTPYSGMLPGYVAGHYTYDDCHIDLRRLAQFANARIYHSEVTGLELTENKVICSNRPPVAYDLLSINIGSRPNVVQVPGASERTLPVKPIDRFLDEWERLIRRVLAAQGSFRIAIVGGGAGGVELSLATQWRLQGELRRHSKREDILQHDLLSATRDILPTHNPRVRRKFQRILNERGIRVHAEHLVGSVEPGHLVCENGRTIDYDAAVWVTDASAQQWLRESGLATDDGGFIKVNDCLRSVSHPNVFAAGDIAAMVNHPRPKSGVFAVRHGPPLADNLRRVAQNKAPKPFVPQTQFLSLISTGDKYAVASRSFWTVEGAWVWRVKDWIDRRFMAKYDELPAMGEASEAAPKSPLADDKALQEISALAMRCGGCGAKVGSTVLGRVVNQLQPRARDDVLIGLQEPDDAAVLEVPPGKVLVQSVDYFRAFIDDAYLFGKVASNHSLSDLFAMGAEAQSAMAIATVPYGRQHVVEQTLSEVMTGALEVLNACGAALVGGHSSEGAELSFGLSVTGLIDRSRMLRKGGMSPGSALILTKPLGTGTLFAADMRHRAKGRWIDAALEAMLQSNQEGATVLLAHHSSACTDVTGFGLLGHLVEMTRASAVDVLLDLEALPVLEGALESLRAGIFSSLQPENVRLRRAIRNLDGASHHPHYPLLFDPQTSGGLLASVPAERAHTCVQALMRAGYVHTRVIGRVEERSDSFEPIVLSMTAIDGIIGRPDPATASANLPARAQG
jgi:selenide,water dikinase